ncbi:MAG: alpha-mannosidase, partial [Butyrivibrio sp.]|nr:alpha-mannosidase [Butyrivibrio sp.]
MPGKEQIIDNIKNYIEELSLKRFPHVTRIQDTEGFDGIYYKKIPYNVRNEVVWDNEGFSLFEPDSLWGGSDQHYYFRFTFKVPEKYDGKPLLMFVSTGADDIWNTDNPQLMIYVNRELACAMDMNHDHVILSECAHAGDEYEIGIYAYSNTEASTNSLGIKLTSKDEDAIRIYYDLETPFEVLQNLPEDDQNQTILLETLERAISLKPEDISKYLLDNLYGKNIHKATVKSVGHTHIDVAWKWPLRQTREKVIRSWTNVLNLMDRYPEYKFMASTPQLYE